MTSAASTYWNQRRARDKARAATLAHCHKVRFDLNCQRAAVASVLPGCAIPEELAALPVIVHQSNGSRLVCRHLVA